MVVKRVDISAWAFIGKGIGGDGGEGLRECFGGGVVDVRMEAGVLGGFEKPFPCCEIGRD